jgi:hypothetical protein
MDDWLPTQMRQSFRNADGENHPLSGLELLSGRFLLGAPSQGLKPWAVLFPPFGRGKMSKVQARCEFEATPLHSFSATGTIQDPPLTSAFSRVTIALAPDPPGLESLLHASRENEKAEERRFAPCRGDFVW